MTEDRRRPGRPADQDIEVTVLPNAAGGVIVRATHRPSQRFGSGSHRDAEQARRLALRELAKLLRRKRR